MNCKTKVISLIAVLANSSTSCCSTVSAARLAIWEFPKIGDPNLVPYIVGSLL